MNLEFFFNYLLQNKKDVIAQALHGELPTGLVRSLTLASVGFMAIFGLLIGSSHSWAQAGMSFIKLPFLFFATGVICFPTLYILLALLGVPVRLKGMTQFCVLTIGIMALILVAFIPISFFFRVIGTEYQAFKLINVAILSVAGCCGVYLFGKYLLSSLGEQVEKGIKTKARYFIFSWLLLFGFIGTNLGLTLSPIFGNPDNDFVFFMETNQNFIEHILSIL